MAAKRKHPRPPGRPTKYTEELLQKAQRYLESYETLGEPVPTIVGLALHCDISKQRVYEWMKDDDKADFRDIVTRVEQKQERGLVSGGLKNDFNPKITGMLLAKHGYSEKQSVDHTTGGEKITKIEVEYVKPAKDADADGS